MLHVMWGKKQYAVGHEHVRGLIIDARIVSEHSR